jgi:hypothetical protein
MEGYLYNTSPVNTCTLNAHMNSGAGMGCVETRGICVCIMIYISVYVCEALDCVYICRVCVYNNWTDAAPYIELSLSYINGVWTNSDS